MCGEKTPPPKKKKKILSSMGIEPTAESIIVLLYIVLKKITTNSPSQGAWIDIAVHRNHALCTQPTSANR